MSPKILKDESGFALIQAIMAGGICLALTAGALKLVDNRFKVAKIMNARTTASLLEDRVRNAATSINAMNYSAYKSSSSSAFAKCLKGVTCKHLEKNSYNLVNSLQSEVSGRFDFDGTPCNKKAEDCSYLVTTNFYPVCTGATTTCSKAEKIVTEYTITHTNQKYTNGFTVKPISGEVELSNLLCPDDQILRGVDANGRFICGAPLASPDASKCAEGTAAYGITEQGDLLCEEVVNYCEKDLILAAVIDTSGSMKGKKMTAAKNSAADFMDYLKNTDESSLVTFSSSAKVQVPKGKGKEEKKDKIKELSPKGSTNMTAGLQAAATTIQGAAGPNTVKGIVFLSDGWHNVGEEPYKLAESLKAQGIQIWTIGLGKDADSVALRRIASSPQDYTYVEDPSDLQGAFNRISKLMCRMP